MKRVVFRRVLFLATAAVMPYICFLMPIDSSDQWPPRTPRDSEFIVSKRAALKVLCDIEPSTIDLVAEKDLYILNDYFEICLSVKGETLDVSLSMKIAGNKQQAPQEVAVGTAHVIVRTVVEVRDNLTESVLAKLAEEDGKTDLRIIANRLLGQAAERLALILEQRSRWNDLDEGQENLRRAYQAIMAGRLPQNSE